MTTEVTSEEGTAERAVPSRWWDGERRRHYAQLLGIGIAAKLLAIAVGLIANGGSSDDMFGSIASLWSHWDGFHYLDIASHGYGGKLDGSNSILWLPLYPVALRATSGVLAIGLPEAAMLVSIVTSLGATLVLYELARTYGGSASAWRTSAFWNLFPTSYFLVAAYAEGLFCLLLFGSVLAARRRSWLVCGILGALASGTRLQGLALVPLLAFELRSAKARGDSLLPVLGAMCATPLGFLGYLAVNQVTFGDPLTFVHLQQQYYFHKLASPFAGAEDALKSMAWREDYWQRATLGLSELVGGVALYGVSVASWVRLNRGDALLAGVMTVMATFLPFWLSNPRYLLSLYPLFLLSGRVRSPVLQSLAVVVGLAGLVIFSVGFTTNRWAF